jgi:hypothetical protein
VDDFRTRTLQLLDDFHARDEARLVSFEAVDLFDLLVELFDLSLEPLVARLLRADHRVHHQVTDEYREACADRCATECNEELELSLLAFFIAPGK